jgi:opacity protein-like surface antigen
MKKLMVLFFCLTSLVFFFSSDAAADSYIAVKAGVYSPQSDDLDEFGEGLNLEASYGYYFNQYLAIDLGVGYFKVDKSESYYADGRQVQKDTDIEVNTFTVAINAIAPIDPFELYALGGAGIYYAYGERKIDTYGVGADSADDTDIVFGGFLGAGLNFNISHRVFLGVEGKYQWVAADWEFEGDYVSADLDGWRITGNLGFRF